MQDILEAIILGIVQGLTEFLPVSSSGHLEILKYFFDENIDSDKSILLTVTLHGATALSTLVVLRKEVLAIFKGLFTKSWNEAKKWVLFIFLSMIPAGIFFFTLEDWITSLFSGNILLVGVMLIVTGILLFVADYPNSKHSPISGKKSIIIGIAQAIAIIPGISRSGATIATSVLLGMDRGQAARFSFLMVLPLIFGKIVLDLMEGDYSMSSGEAIPLSLGAIAAFIVGCLACQWMIKLVKNSQLRFFSYYCFAVAILIIIGQFAL